MYKLITLITALLLCTSLYSKEFEVRKTKKVATLITQFFKQH